MAALENRVCIVTGAARGIGKGIATRFLREGARVWLGDVDQATLAATVADLSQLGPVGSSVVDVTDPGQAAAMVEAVLAEWGGIDVLVNNAGITGVKPIFEVTADDWDRVLATNLKGTFLCTQAVTRSMVERGHPGVVVNIASVNGLRGQPMLAGYGASKAGIINLTRTVALELGQYGIRVNAICPATTHTEMSANVAWDQSVWDDLVAHTALGRLGTVEDVAAAAVFLASDEAAFITGTEIVVDGGLLAQQITIAPERLISG